MKKMRFFLCVVLSAAALWSCGGDGDGEPGPEPPVPPVVDPNAVEVVNSGFEKGLEGWTRVDSTTAAREVRARARRHRRHRRRRTTKAPR